MNYVMIILITLHVMVFYTQKMELHLLNVHHLLLVLTYTRRDCCNCCKCIFRSLIKEVYFPDSMRMLMPNCFQDCQFLNKVDFGTGIEEIGFGHETNIFNGCKSLCSVEIPEQVKSNCEAAFKNSGVQHVVFRGINADTR